MARSDQFTEDTYPRVPLDDDAPDAFEIDWKMAQIHLDQANVALKSDQKSTPLRDNVVRNLEAALDYLRPKPQP